MDIRNLITNAPNLQALRDCLNSAVEMNVEGIDTTSLKTFGGEEPADTTAVFSWDETHILRCEPKQISQHGGGKEAPWFIEPRA